MQAYILFTSPALFLMTAEFYHMIYRYKKNHRPVLFFNLILLLLIALPVRYAIERVKPFNKNERNPQWVANLKKLNDKKITNGVLFNYDQPVAAMFYTNLTVYPDIPDAGTIAGLIENGYTLIINDNSRIPEDIKRIKGVTLEKLTAVKAYNSGQEEIAITMFPAQLNDAGCRPDYFPFRLFHFAISCSNCF